MKLHLTRAEGQHLITGYTDHGIDINHQRYEHSLVVMPDVIITHWLSSISAPEQLSSADFEKIATLQAEVVLLGSGIKHQFLPPALYQALTQKNIPLECMTTRAACHTYNILLGEGRKVAAVLIV